VVRSSVPSGPESGFRAEFAELPPRAAEQIARFLSDARDASASRRAHPRFASSIRLGIATDDEFVEQHAANISAGGMFIRMHDPLPLNSVLTLYLDLPDGGPAAVADVQVVRVASRESDGIGGVGVQFIGADDTFRARVDAYIDTLLA
jgi:uncharacterized protein (TIGR02266 family)